MVRERELHLHLGSTHNGCIPEMKAYGRLAAPLPPGTSALEGADTVLLGPIGEELRALPLSTHEVLCAAADILGAIIHLIVGLAPPSFSVAQPCVPASAKSLPGIMHVGITMCLGDSGCQSSAQHWVYVRGH